MTAIANFEKEELTFHDKSKDVYKTGSGPGVVIMPEIPGITPEVAQFAERLADAGFSVFVVDLFGTPGKEFSDLYAATSLVKACVSKEFVAFGHGKTSPVTTWLASLVSEVHNRCGGKVGVVGMCFTGGFALALAVDPAVKIATMSQPAVPFPTSKKAKRDIGVSGEDLRIVKERAAADDLCVVGLRFTGDFSVPAERFERLREELGDAFIGVEIDSSKGNPHGFGMRSHSVLTMEYKDEPGFPTKKAHDLVINHFQDQLL